jgi:hypothetical protein
MARQSLFDISHLLRRLTHDRYVWWTHGSISYNHGIYSFILVYVNKPFFLLVYFLSDERGKDREVLATGGIYQWSFVTQIFHNSQWSWGCGRKTFEVMTNVHHPNRFAHTKRIWYEYISPIKRKKWQERRQNIFKVE